MFHVEHYEGDIIMIDIKLIRTNPERVKENIKKKFQDSKLPLVDEVAELDIEYRKTKTVITSYSIHYTKLYEMAQGEQAHRSAVSAHEGVLFSRIKKITEKLVSILGELV